MPELIFLIILSGYFVQSILFVIGAKKKFTRLSDKQLPTVTVVVAARNEEDKILRTLESLNKLEYPDGKLEVFIVDDNSSDNTGSIIDEFISGKTIFIFFLIVVPTFNLDIRSSILKGFLFSFGERANFRKLSIIFDNLLVSLGI